MLPYQLIVFKNISHFIIYVKALVIFPIYQRLNSKLLSFVNKGKYFKFFFKA